MNHSYNSFLDKNHPQLLQIYHKESQSHPGGCLILKVDPEKPPQQQIEVFYQSVKNLAQQTIQNMKLIQDRSEKLVIMDRHVLTCANQNQSYPPISEAFFLLIDPKKQILLRGYPVSAGKKIWYEFETFLEKTDNHPQSDPDADAVQDSDADAYLTPENSNFKGQWMIQKTDAGKKYLILCKKALRDPEIYQNFRKPLDYQNIIIGGNQERAEKYFKILEKDPYYYDHLKYLQLCDQIGNPPLFTLPSTPSAPSAPSTPSTPSTSVSTYTLRTLQTTIQLMKHFGDLNNQHIVEIGSGHGGLCQMVSHYINYRGYTLIDLPVVNLLAEKYLDEFPELPHQKIKYMSTEQIIPRKYDLVISEYALSELDLKAQICYFENILQYSQTAYLAMNIWDPSCKQDFKERLGKIFSQIEEYAEEPESNYPNYLWICRRKKAKSSNRIFGFV